MSRPSQTERIVTLETRQDEVMRLLKDIHEELKQLKKDQDEVKESLTKWKGIGAGIAIAVSLVWSVAVGIWQLFSSLKVNQCRERSNKGEFGQGVKIDPVSCVMMATGAFKALKGAIGAGKDLQDMTGQLATWGKAFSDFTNLEEREKNPPFWKKTFKGSDEETALEIFANKKKMEQMRSEIKEHITWHYGKSAWDEVLQIEASMRKRRKDELYRKQQQIDTAINFAIGAVLFAISGGLLFLFFYIWGTMQGRW